MRVKYISERGHAGRLVTARRDSKIIAIRLRGKNGVKTELRAADPSVGFKPNDILDLASVDARMARHLAADPRFQILEN